VAQKSIYLTRDTEQMIDELQELYDLHDITGDKTSVSSMIRIAIRALYNEQIMKPMLRAGADAGTA